jgi:predicted nucleic acid-binding protein
LDGPVESLLARKFSDENLDLLDAIDEMIAKKEGH